MTEKLELYRCEICNNLVEVEHEGAGTLVCCNEDMKLLHEHEANSQNAHFAHVEEIENSDGIKHIKVKFNHVMTKEHHIEFIEAISKDKKYVKRKFLNEDETPEMTIRCHCDKGFYIRLYCNKDGGWVTKTEI